MHAETVAAIPPLPTEAHPTCLLCGSSGTLLYDQLRDRSYGVPGVWQLRVCDHAACGLGWLDPMPTEAGIARAYQTYYTHVATGDTTPPHPAILGEAASGADAFFPLSLSPRSWLVTALRAPYRNVYWLAGIEAERTQMRLMYLHDRPPGRLLEVGCGGGLHMHWLAARGWQVEGQDVDPQAAEGVRQTYGYTVHVGPLADLALSPQSYDAIILNHVLEHVHHPVALLQTCRELLKSGGCLVAATPNFASFGHRSKFKDSWVGLDAPRHLWHFQAQHLEKLARQAGFGEVQARSTSANAELFADMSAYGMAGGHPSLRRELAAKGFQLRATFETKRRKDAGEELFLFATNTEKAQPPAG